MQLLIVDRIRWVDLRARILGELYQVMERFTALRILGSNLLRIEFGRMAMHHDGAMPRKRTGIG